MKTAPSGRRGVFWRPTPRGNQEVRQPGAGRVRGDWWIRWVCQAGHPPHREKIGHKSLAIQEVERRRTHVRLEGGCPRDKRAERPVLFEEAAKEYLAWSKAHKKSWPTDQAWLNRLKRVFAGKTLAEITPEVVERFKLDLVETRSKPTVDRHLALLRHLYNRRIDVFGYAGRNPIRKRVLFVEENQSIRWLTEEDEAALFAVVPEPYRSLCKVALYTGARRGELLAARWDQVDPKRGLLTLPTSKSGKPRHIELSSVALETLAKVPRHLDSPLIFPDCRKVTHRFPAWAKAAGLPAGREIPRAERVTFHTFRHTYATRLVEAGTDLVTLRDLGGWSEKGGLALIQRYAHVGEGHKRAAVEALARGERLVRLSTGMRTERPKALLTLVEGGNLSACYIGGAEGGTRTPTPLRALDPESSASANSATSAPASRR